MPSRPKATVQRNGVLKVPTVPRKERLSHSSLYFKRWYHRYSRKAHAPRCQESECFFASTSVLVDPDPYNIQEGLQNEQQLSDMRRRTRGKRLFSYHSKQNALIISLLKPIEEYTAEAQVQEEADRLPVQIAIWASLIANFSLCILQMYAAISSISLSLLATGIDSIFDIGSNIVLFWLHRKAERLDSSKWPIGGSRLETIGNIVYDDSTYLCRMGSVSLVVVVESCRSIVSHQTDRPLNGFHLPSILSVAAALLVKLLLFLYCFSLRKSSSQVQVLWEDHRNDLWINTFGVLMSTGGSKLRWYLDPMGAIIIGLGIMVAWGRTIYCQFELLAGKSATHEMLQLLIYKTVTFNEDIEKVSTVRAYHIGPDYFVEIDIVMSASTPLWKAHDLSEKLQEKIEGLPNVERAFVHVDYETTHLPEHRKMQ
ncbi:hypothetical protein L218DRAFT_975257 [Marasmius fiardii PR-910]|nr:hypothetical protein L218DRAFT_975257 [Marasmius fiardii PR-910]